jgi:hypothetical protein
MIATRYFYGREAKIGKRKTLEERGRHSAFEARRLSLASPRGDGEFLIKAITISLSMCQTWQNLRGEE